MQSCRVILLKGIYEKYIKVSLRTPCISLSLSLILTLGEGQHVQTTGGGSVVPRSRRRLRRRQRHDRRQHPHCPQPDHGLGQGGPLHGDQQHLHLFECLFKLFWTTRMLRSSLGDFSAAFSTFSPFRTAASFLILHTKLQFLTVKF